jgi:uncharacterized membrane protein
MMEPQRLTARQGWEWIKRGYALFVKAPLIWIVLLFVWFIAAVAISSVPIIGAPLVSLLTPVIWAGLMVGCRELSQNEELELVHLFSGFKQHTSQLVTLGGITLVCQFLILGAMMLVGGATLVSILMSGQPETDPNVIIQAAAGASFAVMLGIVLFFLLMMAMWYAPMLVYFRNVPPVQAIKLSLQGILHNIGPMLVYGITFLLLAILATLPMGLGWFVLLPLVYTSSYASYCDIFQPVKEASSTPREGEVIGPDDQAHF